MCKVGLGRNSAGADQFGLLRETQSGDAPAKGHVGMTGELPVAG